MATTLPDAKGAPHNRTLTYRTSTSWREARAGELAAEGKPTLRVSSPREFRGEEGVWTPEDLFVASVESCHMITFVALAGKADVPILGYRSHANGVLEFVEGDYRFTRIVIFPTITVCSEQDEPRVHALLHETSQRCLVARSIASIVEVNPTIVVQ